MGKESQPIAASHLMLVELGQNFGSFIQERKCVGDQLGFVYGRTQTYYPWWSKEGDPIPEVWFHDVVKPDGSPFEKK